MFNPTGHFMPLSSARFHCQSKSSSSSSTIVVKYSNEMTRVCHAWLRHLAFPRTNLILGLEIPREVNATSLESDQIRQDFGRRGVIGCVSEEASNPLPITCNKRKKDGKNNISVRLKTQDTRSNTVKSDRTALPVMSNR